MYDVDLCIHRSSSIVALTHGVHSALQQLQGPLNQGLVMQQRFLAIPDVERQDVHKLPLVADAEQSGDGAKLQLLHLEQITVVTEQVQDHHVVTLWPTVYQSQDLLVIVVVDVGHEYHMQGLRLIVTQLRQVSELQNVEELDGLDELLLDPQPLHEQDAQDPNELVDIGGAEI